MEEWKWIFTICGKCSPSLLQRAVWRCVATRMLGHCMNESAWRNSPMSTELSALPWTQRAGILEFSRLTQKQGTHTLKCRKCTTIRDGHFSRAVERDFAHPTLGKYSCYRSKR